MITFKAYKQHLKALSQVGIHSRAVETLWDRPPGDQDIFIKHDVEARVDKALKMARIEAAEGHQATYYFQGDLLESKKTQQCIQDIKKLGHEASLHYDVLDANDGDYGASLTQFKGFLADLDALGCPVRSVCPHGNPTKLRDGWKSNKDFFKHPKIREEFSEIIDVVVDFPKWFSKGQYVSDAGFALRKIGNISANDKSSDTAMNDGDAVEWDSLANIAKSAQGLVLSVHPHRFKNSQLSLKLRKILFLFIKKSYLLVRNLPLVPKIANKFYSIARKL
jgi:hypothetical protein